MHPADHTPDEPERPGSQHGSERSPQTRSADDAGFIQILLVILVLLAIIALAIWIVQQLA